MFVLEVQGRSTPFLNKDYILDELVPFDARIDLAVAIYICIREIRRLGETDLGPFAFSVATDPQPRRHVPIRNPVVSTGSTIGDVAKTCCGCLQTSPRDPKQ